MLSPRTLRILRPTLLLALSATVLAQTPKPDPYANFTGNWVGQLEYRDFQTNAQTFLPTWLTITEAPDHSSLGFRYTYDDGPAKTVTELSTVTLTPATEKITFTSDRDRSTDTYAVQGLPDFEKQGRGTLTLTGTGTENKKPVDVRITLTLRRNLYTYRKETRLPGEDFKFRDAYTFTRAEAPATPEAPVPPASAAAPPKPLVGSIAAHPGWPEPKAADIQAVQSVDGILAALYNVISGPAGQPRDWDRMRSLFLPDARLIPARVLPGSPDSTNPSTDAVILSVDGYIARSTPTMSAAGFFEQGVHNDVQQFGNIVHILSTYESRHATADPAPFARGINSIQLLKDGSRYWIVNILWDSERPNSPIPGKYLPH